MVWGRAEFTVGEGLIEELEALGDLAGGVDVGGGAVLGGEVVKGEAVAVEDAVAIGEGAGGGLDGNGLRSGQGLSFGSGGWGWGRQCVWSFRDDDPGDDVGEQAGSTAEEAESPDETDDGDVPAAVQGDAGADASDHARFAGAKDSSGGIVAGIGRG